MPRVAIPDGPDTVTRRMFAAHQPAYLKPWADMMEAVYTRTILPFRMRELMRYRIALINGCNVCKGARFPSASGETVPEELYANILSADTSPLYTPAEKVGIDFARRFALDHHSMDDGYFDVLRTHFTESEIVDMTFLTGRHMAFGRLTRVLGLDDTCDMASQVVDMIRGAEQAAE